MTGLLMLPVILSLVLLSAHAYRAGLPPWVAVVILLLSGLLGIRRRWAARILQTVLTLGGGEWLRTTVVLALQRKAAGQPASRMVIILGVVALLTLAAAGVFRHRKLRRRFRID